MCGLELLVLDESLSGMPNQTWTRDVPYIVAQAQCEKGHTPYLLKRREQIGKRKTQRITTQGTLPFPAIDTPSMREHVTYGINPSL